MTWTIQNSGNLFTYPDDDFSDWVSNATLSTSTETTIFGQTTVTTIEDQSTTEFGQIYVPGAETEQGASTETRCFSIFIKKDSIPASTRYVGLRMSFGFPVASSFTLRVDTSTGQFLNVPTDVIFYSSDVEDFGEYWRAWIAIKANATFYRVNFFPALGKTSLTTGSADATATGSATVFGATLEFSESPSFHYKWIIESDKTQTWNTQTDSSSVWVNQ